MAERGESISRTGARVTLRQLWSNFLGGGLILLLLAGWGYYRTLPTLLAVTGQAQWDSVPGVVTRSSSQRVSDRNASYKLIYNFEYEYSVDGKTYTSDRYSLASAETEYQGYKALEAGTKVQIYHHPKRPGLAVIERGRPGIFIYLLIALSTFFAWLGIGMTWTGEFLAGLDWFRRGSR